MKSKRIWIAVVLMALVFQVKGQKLTKVWETDSLFNKPESVLFDETNQIIYVSSINGKYRTKDGNGFVSKIDTAGNILNLKWIGGLSSPQGMGIHGDRLYVADLDQVVEVNIPEAKVSQVFPIAEAIFLNDVTTDREGNVYVSDCVGNKIYRIKNGDVQVWLDDLSLKEPNGLLAADGGLFVLNMRDSSVLVVQPSTKSITKFAEGIPNCDGIVSDGESGYFVSGAWQGQIFHLDETGAKSLLLDLGNEKTITADIAFIPDMCLLLVPTLHKTVIAYRWDE
jgi:sugar lactone lactonase YvrE